ncbi:MAG: hypothetical protein KJO07_10580 [Deltaproteobacteria bacterium]|nr:hypothetical protein [Deltaproteobacteria bacterium]
MSNSPAKFALLSMTLVAAVSLNPDKAAANGEQQQVEPRETEGHTGAELNR